MSTAQNSEKDYNLYVNETPTQGNFSGYANH